MKYGLQSTIDRMAGRSISRIDLSQEGNASIQRLEGLREQRAGLRTGLARASTEARDAARADVHRLLSPIDS